LNRSAESAVATVAPLGVHVDQDGFEGVQHPPRVGAQDVRRDAGLDG
jgi:hypothetical protein